MEVAVMVSFPYQTLVMRGGVWARDNCTCNLWPRFLQKLGLIRLFLNRIILSTSRAWTKDVDMSEKRLVKKHRWYLGGFASAGAAVFTHPLDLMKVRQAPVHAILQMFSSIVYVLLSDVYSLCSHTLSEVSQQWCSELASTHKFVLLIICGTCDWSVQVTMNVFAAISSTPVPQHSISSWPITNNSLPMFIDKGAFIIMNICTEPMN